MAIYIDWLTRLTNEYGGPLALIGLAAVLVPAAIWLWTRLAAKG